jgi:hypothetical protein
VGGGFESIGVRWLSNKKFAVSNMFIVAALWGLWKCRNDCCFRNISWQSMKHLLLKIVSLAQNWLVLPTRR